ncbi:MAG: Rpn family recombination-promoting nuclease/putative transposase [gamma proteobacterium symbiont of Taylorina sp.]|nr:Rpn family recombination-promoting nuclease/putative transposase [gamma proteobacterium symbiont of Taylorina sp.]
MFHDFSGFHSHFGWYDEKNRLKLTEHANIHIIELNKWDKSQVENDLDRWTRFFREGKDLNNAQLPNFWDDQIATTPIALGQVLAIHRKKSFLFAPNRFIFDLKLP